MAVPQQFPRSVNPKAPPIKTQGIKTKLIPFIFRSFQWDGQGTWVEPFMGSGAVAFNAMPKKALLADTNRHIIAFYKALQSDEITSALAREYLTTEGERLLSKGEDHFYEIRKRFNEKGDPLDFLFLSRSCFNGVMRFNKKGGFNVPFCRKPDRFRQAYVTKIVNQIAWVSRIIHENDWRFECQGWRETLSSAAPCDFAYIDPPYVGRHTDYFNSWDENEADSLASSLREIRCGFAYSMWHKNMHRENEHLKRWFSDFPVGYSSHFYHVGSSEDLRGEMEEALVVSHSNYVVADEAPVVPKPALQLGLL